jgi:hypothetical protein
VGRLCESVWSCAIALSFDPEDPDGEV